MKILLVTKRSSYEVLAEDAASFATLQDRHPETVRGLVAGHRQHVESVSAVQGVLEKAGHEVQLEDRARLAQISRADLVVTVGGDGTLLEAARHVTQTPVLAVNSDPHASVAHFSACTAENFSQIFAALGTRQAPLRRVARLQVKIDGEEVGRPVLNDVLLAHRNPAATTRVTIGAGRDPAIFKCSGVWAATAAGSSAAMASAGGRPLPFLSRRWQYLVREPYRPRRGWPTHAILGSGESLVLVCGTQAARLYLDGPHRSLAVGIGSRISIEPGAPDLYLYRPS